jgi:predicted nucleic acid-binding protein
MPVADTSFLIDVMRRDHAALRIYDEYERQDIALATTAITAMELYKGAYTSRNRRNVEKAERILDLFTLLPLDEMVYQAFGRIAGGLCLAGNPIGDFDEAIAAITLCYDGEIITRDRHFEKIPELKVIVY